MYVDTWIICTVIHESVSYQTCHRLIDYLLLFFPPFRVVKSNWIINNSFLFWCGVSLSNSTCCLYFDLTYRLIKMQHNLLATYLLGKLIHKRLSVNFSLLKLLFIRNQVMERQLLSRSMHLGKSSSKVLRRCLWRCLSGYEYIYGVFSHKYWILIKSQL